MLTTIALTLIGYRAILAVANTGPAGSLRAKVSAALGGPGPWRPK